MTTPAETSFPKSQIRVLLLENVHTSAHEVFRAEGFQVEACTGALGEDALVEKARDVHILGIRSRSRVTERVLSQARRVLTLGTFCIGTNQVALESASQRGVPVFNAPFSSTRSVAELVIAEVIALSRRLADRSREMHEGRWRKSAPAAHEVRGKTLGIVGYGHIGTQVGILAEAVGMQVLFHDVVPKLPIGNNRRAESLEDVLGRADFVTLHVPETPLTRGLIGERELARMRPGAYLLNLSRGSVVDLGALAKALGSGHLAGAAADVFPVEPAGNSDGFATELRGVPNVILTPHVGGSTEEAQEAIGREVATALVKFVNTGATTGSVNFPHIEPPPLVDRHRLLNVHRNVPGVLSSINKIVSDAQANVESQILATNPAIGYLVMDLNREVSEEVRLQMSALETNIRTRVLY
ncbi:MAG: phosphoglycerate dehydrogenase [Acidobacteria bacterium]|jgi:D-3-phosphoglycerate dehydrogenase|nr:phosphoglycerate dehydrogenase [Acidobacteriota bacterium]